MIGKKIGWSAVDLVVIAFALIPVAWLLSLSLKDPTTVAQGGFLPKKWTFDNYSAVFTKGNFLQPLINSIGIALLATLIAIVLGTFAAYAIARLEFPGRNLMLGAALLVAMFPQVSLVTPLFNIERSTGLFNTWPGLILPYVTFALPLTIYTMSTFFREIPWELEKAAKMDGASSFQAFRKVIVPLATPGVVTAAVLAFIQSWNDFLFSISLTSTDRARTAPAAIAFFTGASQFDEPAGSIAAAAVIVTIPIVIFVLIFQRRIVSGLTAGAVKG
ncbi:MAG TPA: carbohydrate ABC transporter permease [Stackebrandtia sp.]|jgi:multiple sugar transport system permease protein|uniref:carbohydrate ABC transporter permease n=1 Tax=Stackebrandtia sp. TaxID=2023065 RepID=UPI002D24502A|nr:carbohydrate ABC transporter permease [Stackebrandtia sp.]HZE42075.1 carbohydrate ABC transporter permease [Stackebrandtia sp.]